MGKTRLPVGQRRIVDVAVCLRLPEFEAATVLAGENRLTVPVRWISVIEWPVENFVSPGDLVLTTGIGCNDEQVVDMVTQISRSGAAGICFSAGPGAPFECCPKAVTAEAARQGVALVEIPWRLRFSDLSRAVIHCLYSDGYTLPRSSQDLPVHFTRALLGPGGVADIAGALESVVEAPSLVLNASMAVEACSESVATHLSGPGLAISVVSALAGLVATSSGSQPLVSGPIEDLPGLSVVASAAVASGDVLGWVVTVLSTDADHEVARRAVLHAATALAIGVVRGRAAAEAENTARDEFMWDIALGEVGLDRELATRSALLGLPLNLRFSVGLGLLEQSGAEDESDLPGSREIARRIRMQLKHPSSIVAARENELLVCVHASEPEWRTVLDDPAIRPHSGRLSWGFASGQHTLVGLQPAVAQARTALAVIRALCGPGSTGDASRLGAFMLLHTLSTDPAALEFAHQVVEPLEHSDRARGSEFVKTLSVFLEENGNISSAARELHLNRHSLIYRLARIEELTQRNLSSHEDRLLLDISIKLSKLSGIDGVPERPGTVQDPTARDPIARDSGVIARPVWPYPSDHSVASS